MFHANDLPYTTRKEIIRLICKIPQISLNIIILSSALYIVPTEALSSDYQKATKLSHSETQHQTAKTRVWQASTNRIRLVQEILTKRGFSPGPIDGVMGSKTHAAIRAFEKSKHLPITGEISPTFYAALFSFGTSNPALPLVHAVEIGDLAYVEQHINRYNLEQVNSNGWTLLTIAVAYGHSEIALFLLDRGADVHVRQGIYTLLHKATDARVAKRLIQAGVPVDVLDGNGKTPLQNALSLGHDTIAIVIMQQGANTKMRSHDGTTLLHLAAWGGANNSLVALVSNGANINDRNNKYGDTPLHRAAFSGHINTVRILLGMGANINVKTRTSGDTPLHLAASEGHTEVVDILARRADTMLRNHRGKTALDVAQAFNQTDAVKILQSTKH